jgi:cytidylate kinase
MSREFEELVASRIRAWEAEQREIEQEKARQRDLMVQRPSITLSRLHGAAGREVADRVAERLKLTVYEKQLIEFIAKSASVRARVVESVQKKVHGQIGKWLAEMFDKDHVSDSEYLRHLTRVLLTISRQDRAVLVDFGAQFVLNRERSLMVRVIAPKALRVERLTRTRSVDAAAARAEIERVDSERRDYCKRHFDREIADPEHYDLVINMAYLSSDIAADIICDSYRTRFG